MKRWRLTHHLSQKKMARDLGFGDSTLGSWETGARFPDGVALENIAIYTGLTPCRLFCDHTLRCVTGQCLLLTGRA